MLWHKTIGAGGVSRDLELVFQDAQFNNTDNSFTRGISFADVREDDLIILSIATRKNSDITYSATNFTKLTDLYVNSTDDTNFAMFYKVADGTETGIDVTTNLVNNNLTIVAIYRNADTSNPIDVTIATNTATGATLATSPNVTTVTDNAIIYQVVAAAGQGTNRPLVNFTQPSSTDNFIQIGALASKLAACTSVQETAGTTSLNNFGGGTGYSGNSSITATLAIRPSRVLV